MIYNITTGESSNNLDPITPNNVRLALKSNEYIYQTINIENFTGGPTNINESTRFPTISSNGTQPGTNSGAHIIDDNIYLIK